MASHLSVITSTASGTLSRGLSSSPASQDKPDAFAALLGDAGSTPVRSRTPASASDNVATVALDGQGGEQSEDPEAVAVAIDAVLPIQSPVDPKAELADLVAGLGDLKAALDAGKPVDPEALKRIDAALQKLSSELNIDLGDLPTLDELKTMASAVPADDVSLEAQLTKAFAPLAEKLVNGEASSEMTAETAELAKSVGEKLAALLKSLSSGDPAQENLLALDVDPELKDAIAKLSIPAVKVDASVAAQALAIPELKLPEPIVSRKATETPASPGPSDTVGDTAATAAPAPVAARADGETDRKSNDKPDQHKAEPAPVAAVRQAVDDATAATQQPPQTTRVEAAVAARPIVAGYQTSQQQLNLPQIAFEVARQVSEGTSRFQIRLDPAELGKIDVRLDIDKTGQVTARLTVEKAETLDLMQRDQRGLEKALQQAGLDSSKTNLEFSLKQNPFSGGQQGQGENSRQPMFGAQLAANSDEAPAPTVNLYRGSLSASGVNIIA